MKKLFLLILAVVLLFSSCNFNHSQMDKTQENTKFIAVWFTYEEIKNLCEKSNSIEELEKNVKNTLTELQRYNVNSIFLHARAFDDCFYKSEIFQVSEYCKNEKGELKFDVLEYFIKLAKNYNISIHAWLNPYRIRNDNRIDKISANSFAGKILSENIEDERIIITDNSIYYNPAYPEVQNYVLNGIRELLENYKIDGIHIDDYFYPTTDQKIDEIIYEEYIANGGVLNLADFRRNAVNSLISSMYSLVKSFDSNILVSISPSADIAKNYNNSYADIKLWASNDGYADILIPQLYFGFEHSTMPFNNLLNEWLSLQNENTKIIIGLAVYKSNTKDEYAGAGEYEWVESDDVILRQIETIKNSFAYGWSYFSASHLLNK